VDSIVFWGPVVLGAALAAIGGYLADRRRSRRPEVLLQDGWARSRSQTALRYFNEVGDSSNA
jgi:hypothetical protein